MKNPRSVISLLLAALIVPLSLTAAEDAGVNPTSGWRQVFDVMPPGWKVDTKPGVKAAVFTVVPCAEAKSGQCLNMEADKATASLTTRLTNVDLTKTPILRWRWRVTTFPEGADGREDAKDDQAIGIYVSTGGMFSQKSIAYRWETETPMGTNGNVTYAAGVVKVKWYALRNKKDGDGKTFLTEERNVAEDFKAVYGELPTKIGIGVSCNSQYTGTKAAAQLEWIELVPK